MIILIVNIKVPIQLIWKSNSMSFFSFYGLFLLVFFFYSLFVSLFVSTRFFFVPLVALHTRLAEPRIGKRTKNFSQVYLKSYHGNTRRWTRSSETIPPVL